MNIKRFIIPILTIVPLMTNAENIFLEEFKTTHNFVPFDRIERSFYEQAVDSGIRQANKEIEAKIQFLPLKTPGKFSIAL